MAFDSAALAWFRRDLRLEDHAALHAALTAHGAVHCAFVFDTEILEPLPRADRRVDFLWHSVAQLKATLERLGGGLHVLHGRAREEIPRLATRLGWRRCIARATTSRRRSRAMRRWRRGCARKASPFTRARTT